MRIVCVGAGPAGLYFAILMKVRNPAHEVTVLERNPAGVTYGWGVVFWDDLLEEVAADDAATADTLRTHALRWQGEQLFITGRDSVVVPEPGYGIGRRRLLDLLAERADRLGVRILFEHEVTRADELADADLVVAADGVHSRVRQLVGDHFGTRFVVGRNKYLWLGTDRVFDTFTFAFEETHAGWIWCHAYGFDDRTSTFIVECSPEVWAGLGFDRIDREETLARLAGVFEAHLEGRPLQAKGASRWRSFRTLTNETWHHGNVVLMGDAAHSTHFTIGSGTKLALEDAAALSRLLHEEGCLEDALVAYEQERKTALRPKHTDARYSARWYEEVPRYIGLDPVQVFALMHERRSPLLPHCPPRLYYRLHQATHDVPPLRTLRRWAAPRIKALSRPLT